MGCAEAAGGCGARLWEGCRMGKGLHRQREAVEDGQGRSLLFCKAAMRVTSIEGSHWREGNHPSLQGPRAWWHLMDPVLLTHAAPGGLGSGQRWAVPELLGLWSSAMGAVGWENQVQGREQARDEEGATPAWKDGEGESLVICFGIFCWNFLVELSLVWFPPTPHLQCSLLYRGASVLKNFTIELLVCVGRFRCEF